MKHNLLSSLLIIVGTAILVFGLVGLFGNSAPQSNPPDPQFETVIEYSAEEVGAGFAPLTESADPSGAPTLAITPSTQPELPQGIEGKINPALPTDTHYEPPEDLVPDRIVIEKIGLDAPVVLAGMRVVKGYEQEYTQWLAPDKFAAGWHADSAKLGQVGNTVINGHHNVFGEVFKDLKDLQSGDKINVYSGGWEFTYVVANVMILPERDQKLRLRLDNAQWIEHSNDERLTLVTCWPPESNTHRVIVVAIPQSYRLGQQTEIIRFWQPESPK